jgi:ankyrin repeat protein
MSDSKLPQRASLEYLRKLAKDRLHDMRRTDPKAKLSAALLAVARDYGFPSWRVLKAELDRRQTGNVALFFEACAKGDLDALRNFLAVDPSLVRAHHPDMPYPDATGLHAVAVRGHVDAVRLLLAHGADVNARETADNATPLHWAAGQNKVEAARVLIEAGADVADENDLHETGVLGFTTALRPESEDRSEMIRLLLDHGARHHIFSAIAVGDHELIQKLVEQNPAALDRRMSRFEQGQSPVHFAISRNRYDILDLLIDLGADLEAEDKNGNTPLAVAMVKGDREAMTRLTAAGAIQPEPEEPSKFRENMTKLASSVKKGVPMVAVPNVETTLEWYKSIGFTELGRFADDENGLNFGMVSFGGAEVMFVPGGSSEKPHDVSLWFYTDQVDRLYQTLKSKQIEAARTELAGQAGTAQGIVFAEDINDPFYGGRQFCIRDLNGFDVLFLQP